jgi:hypothetical protein
MDWTNLLDPVKSNPKNWVGSDKSVYMDFKNEKPIKKIWVLDKTGLNPKNPPTR